MAVGRALAVIFSISLAFSTGACGTNQYASGGKLFDTPSQALDNTRASHEQVVAGIEPQPQPIASTAVLMIPTRDQVYAAHKKVWQEIWAEYDWAWSSKVEDSFVYTVDQRELFWMAIPRVLERRKIFTNLEIIRGEIGSPAVPPSGDYLLLGEEAPKAGNAGVFTFSGDDLPPIDPLNASYIVEGPGFQLTYGTALEFLLWVEDFVKAYRPRGS